jgi:hypothetical protein
MPAEVDWKLVDKPSGAGALYRKSGRQVGVVTYDLELYEAVHSTRSGIVVDLKRIEGRVADPGLVDLIGQPLRLHLKDGRQLDILIINEHGAIEDWSGRGLYRPTRV